MENQIQEENDEQREVSTAALQLTVLKHSKLDPETLPILTHMKSNFLSDKFPDRKTLKLISDHRPPLRPPIQGLPQSLIGPCTEPYEKQLTVSDMKKDQSRITLRNDFVRNCILPLLEEGEDPRRGIPVRAYDADGEEFEMMLRQWSEKFYVLTSGWWQFAVGHGLVCHQDFVTVWVFRRVDTGELCVGLTSRRLPVYRLLPRSSTAR